MLSDQKKSNCFESMSVRYTLAFIYSAQTTALSTRTEFKKVHICNLLSSLSYQGGNGRWRGKNMVGGNF